MNMSIRPDSEKFMIIGDPVKASLTPMLHNAAYKAIGASDRYVMIAATVSAENLKTAIEGVRGLGFSGLAVTMPHKQTIMPLLDEIDPIAEIIGAVNTVVRKGNKLIGYNTDWLGIGVPLMSFISPTTHPKAVILGAGGASRAAAYALKKSNVELKILNRTVEHAKSLAAKFSCDAGSLDDRAAVEQAHIVINCTPVGMGETSLHSPIPLDWINARQIVFETIYFPRETKLLSAARLIGAKTIDGLNMFCNQAIHQFELHTGRPAPAEDMRKTLQNL